MVDDLWIAYLADAGGEDGFSENLAQLRQVHSSVVRLLSQLLDAEIGKSEFQEEQRKVKSKLSLLLSQMTSSQLLSSLAHESTKRAQSIQEIAANIDPVADARNLR